MANPEELAQAVRDLGVDPQGDTTKVQRCEQETRRIVDQADAAALDCVLATLSPRTNPQGYIVALAARSRLANQQDVQLLFWQFSNLLTSLNRDNANILPCRFAQLSRQVAQLACAAGPELALSIVAQLRTALSLANPDSTHLNPIQADFMAVCLMAKAYEVALPLARVRFAHVHWSHCEALEANDVLLICYYKALIFLGLKRFEEAGAMLALLFSAPAQNSSNVHLLAYKKLLLVSEIVDGMAPLVLPKYAQGHARRLQGRCGPYIDLSTAIRNRNVQKVQGLMNTHRQSFERDENFGLVKQVQHNFFRRQVYRLTGTFSRLALTDVAAKAGLVDRQAAEQLIRVMVARGQLCASIDQRLGMVSFDEDQGDPLRHTADFQTRQMRECLQCLSQLSQFRDDVVSDPWFRDRENSAKDKKLSLGDRDAAMMKDRDDDEI